jgi:hypothetical protein
VLQGVLGGSHVLKYRFGEWGKAAELVMVMVPGSVEDESKFSTLKTSVTPRATGYKRST